MSDNPLVKKRGRKPKAKIIDEKITTSPINSEQEVITAHLPISLEDVINISNDFNNKSEDDIFIKSESDFGKIKLKEKTEISIKPLLPTSLKNDKNDNEENALEKINQKILEAERIFMLGKNVNKINVHNIQFKPGTKCLWCKNQFDTPPVELPQDYFNNIFFCSGHFCSWNCAKAHNIDLNDSSTWKRESLLNLMYYKTYGEFKDFLPAPSWLLLEDFGGFLSIKDFRSLFITNNKDYLVLHPPMVTRQLQIEESYKKSLSNQEGKLDTDFLLKRSKPVESSNFNLEKTIGLKRKPKKLSAE